MVDTDDPDALYEAFRDRIWDEAQHYDIHSRTLAKDGDTLWIADEGMHTISDLADDMNLDKVQEDALRKEVHERALAAGVEDEVLGVMDVVPFPATERREEFHKGA